MQHADIMTIDPTTKSGVDLTARDLLVIEIAKQTAIGMKKSASAHNIRRTEDYIDALTFAGLLVQKNKLPDRSGDPVFLDVLEEMAPVFHKAVASGQIADASNALAEMKDEIGLVTKSPAEMLVTLGLTAEGILVDIARSYDLDKRETMQVISFAIIFALVASTSEESRDDAIAAMLVGAGQKIIHWDSFIPSDDEIFGDLLSDDDDEDDDTPA